MHFFTDNNWFKAVRITGPTHNLLGLMFGHGHEDNIIMHSLPTGSAEACKIDPNEVLRQVKAGVAEANREMGTAYKVKEIQFVSTDTPSQDVYSLLAKSIIERLARHESFERVK